MHLHMRASILGIYVQPPEALLGIDMFETTRMEVQLCLINQLDHPTDAQGPVKCRDLTA